MLESLSTSVLSQALSLPSISVLVLVSFSALLLYKNAEHKRVKSVPNLPGFVRKLDPFERYLACIQDRGSFMINFTLLLRTPSILTVDILKEAAWRWVQRNKILRTCIETAGPFYEDGCLKEITPWSRGDLPVRECTSSDWRKVHAKMMNEKYDTSKAPLWRLEFVPNIAGDLPLGPAPSGMPRDMPHTTTGEGGAEQFRHALVFGFHHSLTDGISAIHLMGEYVNDIIDIIKQRPFSYSLAPIHDRGLNSYIAQPTFIESLVMWLMSFRTCVPPVTFLTRRLLLGQASNLPKVGVGITQDTTHAVIPMLLSESDTSLLVSSCRRNGCTVQGVLQAALGLAVAQTEGFQESVKEVDVTYLVPANLRGHMKPTIPTSAVGNYFTMIPLAYTFQHDMTTAEVWERAKAIREYIHGQLQSGAACKLFTIGHGPAVLVQRGMETWDRLASQATLTGRSGGGVFMSNLGLCRALEHKGYDVIPEALFGSASMQKLGPIFALNCTTLNKRMGFTFNYIPELTPTDCANQVAEGFYGAIQRLIEQDQD